LAVAAAKQQSSPAAVIDVRISRVRGITRASGSAVQGPI